jgi:outer membrane receptor protein involved in Fe transport
MSVSSASPLRLLLALAASAAATAWAQAPLPLPLAGEGDAAGGERRPSEVVTLEPFNVTDSLKSETTLPGRPVTGVYGFATPYQDVPRSLAQITPAQFTNDTILSVNDFARYSPATSLLTGAASNSGTPYFRGAQGDLYQNGVRLLTRGTNNRPFTLNPYEQADLVAGPASVVFGPSARTAGYVNYITKQPYFDRARGSLTLNLGRWYQGDAGTKPQDSAQVDIGAPLVAGKLAYRFSYEASTYKSYYQNTDNRFNNVFGALGWRPNRTTALDVNFEYGHYNWTVNNFQNRVTNSLIRNGTYLSGPATPIIQVGSAYYSPVLDASGAPTGSWLQRSRVVGASGLTSFTAGATVGNPTSNSTAGAGTIVGYVLDPSLVRATNVERTAALNARGYPSLTDAFNIQTRLRKEISPTLTLANNLTYGRYNTDTSSNGGFYNYILANSIEDRFEAQTKFFYRLFGLNVEHDANTGVAYRWEPSTNFKDTQAAGYGPTGDQYDLTGAAGGWTRNAYFGATVYPYSGLASDPVLTRFGYLKGFWQYLPVPQSSIGGATTPGGSATGTAVGTLGTANYDTLEQWASIFSQHSIKLGSHVIWDVGARASLVWASISNPLPSPNVPGNNLLGGSVRVSEPSVSSSLSYKPAPWITTYVTYNRVTAVNGNTSGAAAWSTNLAGVPNQFDPFNFKSVSELREAGAKAELIPDKLQATVAVFRQTRALTLALPAGAAATANPIQAVGLFTGGELGLRYQPTRRLSVGVNYSYLEATNQDSTYSAPAPLVADNATNILGATTSVRGVDYRAVNLPHNTANAYVTYEFSSGLGLKLDYSVHGSYNVTTDGAVTVPGEYTLNVGAYYNQPRYRVALDVGNVTNQLAHAGGATPLPTLNAGLRVTYRF